MTARDPASILALLEPVSGESGRDTLGLPELGEPKSDAPAPAVLPSGPPRRPRRTAGQGKHLQPRAGGRTAGGQVPSEFSDICRGVPSNQELIGATSQLLRQFHGRATTQDGNYAKHAAVAFGVLVDKLIVLRSAAAQPIVADDAEHHRDAVIRLVQRLLDAR